MENVCLPWRLFSSSLMTSRLFSSFKDIGGWVVGAYFSNFPEGAISEDIFQTAIGIIAPSSIKM